jgi:hypothetical protein
MPKALTMEEKTERAITKSQAKRLAAQAPQPVAETTVPQVRTVTQRSKRENRTSFNGTEAKLRIGNLIDGYHLHILNDTPGRIDQALSAGYEFVSPDEVGGVASNVVSRNTDLGDKVRFLVGTTATNEPMYAYLMKIELDLYNEDQQALQSKNDRVDDAIRGGRMLKEGHTTEGFYKPDGGIKMTRT